MFEGPDALKLFSDISVNSFENYKLGQTKHLIHCSEVGKVIAQGVLIRAGELKFVNQSLSTFYSEFMLKKGNYNATFHERQTFNFQVSGPKALQVVEKLAPGRGLREIKFMNVGTLRIKGREVSALRQGMAGEIGFELQGPKEYAQEIYDAVLEAGKEFGIRRLAVMFQ